MPNDQLFIDVLTQIEREPATWDQGWWARETVCGTSYCFAGWAAVLSGYSVSQLEPDTNLAYAKKRGGRRLLVETAAAKELELPACQNSYGDYELFCAGNDIGDLYEISADTLRIDETVLREKVRAEL